MRRRTQPARRLDRRRRLSSFIDIRPVVLAIGIVLLIMAAFMVPPMIADIAANDGNWQAFLLSFIATLFIGLTLVLMNRTSGPVEITPRQGFMLTTLVWICSATFASLPFVFSDLNMTVAESFFEAMSGLTTTGSTVIVGLDDAPPGILLWRAILQWLGGIGIIVMGVAILPMLSVGGMQLFRMESSDRSDKILPRAAQIASAIGLIYVGLSLLCAVLYWAAEMSPFDAVAHAMTTIATGGYSTSDASIGKFDSAAVEWIAVVFMFIGGIPFVLYIQAVRGNFLPLRQDIQLRWFAGILIGSIGLLTIWLAARGLHVGLDGVRYAAFTTLSVVTGTGYASTDYGTWGYFPVSLVFFLMCVGGCTGSTTGGIKVFRFTVLYAIARVQIQRLLQPSGVFRPLYNGRPVNDTTAISILAFVFLFAMSFAVLAITLSFIGLDYITAMSAALTALANVGPGLGGIIGPSGHFHFLPESAKWVLSFGMLLGRLELLTVLVLLTPMYWRG